MSELNIHVPKKNSGKHKPKLSNYLCVRVGNEVKRLKRIEAESLVSNGKGKLVPRSVWKKEVRDVNKVEEQPEVKDTPKKPKRNPKGKARKKEKKEE